MERKGQFRLLKRIGRHLYLTRNPYIHLRRNRLANIELAAKTGTDRIELYTEPYATYYPEDRDKAIAPFVEAAQLAKNLGLGVNAGHDLNLENLAFFNKNIPWLEEVSIGHALICDALYHGLQETIALYKACLNS